MRRRQLSAQVRAPQPSTVVCFASVAHSPLLPWIASNHSYSRLVAAHDGSLAQDSFVLVKVGACGNNDRIRRLPSFSQPTSTAAATVVTASYYPALVVGNPPTARVCPICARSSPHGSPSLRVGILKHLGLSQVRASSQPPSAAASPIASATQPQLPNPPPSPSQKRSNQQQQHEAQQAVVGASQESVEQAAVAAAASEPPALPPHYARTGVEVEVPLDAISLWPLLATEQRQQALFTVRLPPHATVHAQHKPR